MSDLDLDAIEARNRVFMLPHATEDALIAEIRRLRERYEPTPEQMTDVERRVRAIEVVPDPNEAAVARARALLDDPGVIAVDDGSWADVIWPDDLRAALDGA